MCEVTHQQSAAVVKIGQQNAAVLEQVGWEDVTEEVPYAGLETSIQLSVDVKLPWISWFLHLQNQNKNILFSGF